MSVALTKQTIAGSELPVSDLCIYVQNTDNGGTYLLKAVSGTNNIGFDVKKQLLIPFPPSSFAEALTVFRTSLNIGFDNLDLLKLKVIGCPAHSFSGEPLLPLVVLYDGVIKTTFSSFNADQQKPAHVTVPNRLYTVTQTDGFASTVIGSRWNYAVQLGNDGSGDLNTFITVRYFMYPSVGTISEGQLYTKSLNFSHLEVVNNSVACYGGCFTGDDQDYLYTLLKRDGTFALTSQFSDTVYGRFNIPSGGEIKQFMNGYYLATDGGGSLYLYSINNGGELITALTGEFNTSLPLAFLDVV